MGYYDSDKKRDSGSDKKTDTSSHSSSGGGGFSKEHEKEQERQAKEREKLRKQELDFQKEKFKTQQRNRATDDLEKTKRDRERQKRASTQNTQVQKNPDTVSQGGGGGPDNYQAPGETFGQQDQQPQMGQPSSDQEVPETNITPVPEIGKRFLGKHGDWAIISVELDEDEGSLKAENQDSYDQIFMNYRNGKWWFKMTNREGNGITMSSPSYLEVMKGAIDELDAGGKLKESVTESTVRSQVRSLIKELIADEEIEEVSQTGAVAGYQSPHAFAGKQKTNKTKMRQNATQLGYELIEEPPDADEVYDPKNPVYEVFNTKDVQALTQLGASLALSEEDVHELIKHVFGQVRNRLHEGRRGRYHEFRDDERQPHRKLAESLRKVREQLVEIECLIDMNLRLKEEMGLENTKYWSRSHRALRKIEEKLVRILHKVKGF